MNFCLEVRFRPNCHHVDILRCFKMEIKENLNVQNFKFLSFKAYYEV